MALCLLTGLAASPHNPQGGNPKAPVSVLRIEVVLNSNLERCHYYILLQQLEQFVARVSAIF